MDISWLDLGDFVEVKLSDSIVRGEVLKISPDGILLKNSKGLKSMISLSSIALISQIDSLDATSTEIEYVAPAPKEQALSVTISSLHEELLSSPSSFSRGPWSLEEIKKHSIEGNKAAQRELLSIVSSLEYSLKKDKSSVNDKVSSSITRLKNLYLRTDNPELLEIIASTFSFYSADFKEWGDRFASAYKFLENEGADSALRILYFHCARLGELLLLYKDYISFPVLLLKAIDRAPKPNPFEMPEIADSLYEIYDSTTISTREKNLIFYAVAKKSTSDPLPDSAFPDSQQLLEDLYDIIEKGVPEAFFTGIVVSVSANSGYAVCGKNLVSFIHGKSPTIRPGDKIELSLLEDGSSMAFEKILRTDDPLKAFLKQAMTVLEELASSDITADNILVKLKKLTMSESVPSPEQYSASNITKLTQSAKTPEECENVREILQDYIDQDAPNKLSIIKELIWLCVRKNFAQYNYAFSVFEKYRHLFEHSEAEATKLYRLIIPAYMHEKRYDKALALLEKISPSQSPALERIQLATCYLNLPNGYDKAIDCCNKVISLNRYTTPELLSAYACLFVAYIGKDDLDNAEIVLNKYSKLYTGLPEKVDNMRELLKHKRESGSALDNAGLEMIEEILQVSDSNESFTISELYTEYFKHLLDECEFLQVRDRTYDKKVGKYFWIPKSNNDAKSEFSRLLKSHSIFSKDGTVRTGVFEESAGRRLDMAKIAEYCLLHISDLNLENTHAAEWKGLFVWVAAEYMWLLHRSYKIRSTAKPDTAVHYLLDSLSMYFKEDTKLFKTRYEFFDALNSLIVISSGIDSKGAVDIKPFRRNDLDKKRLSAGDVDEKISSAEKTVQGNLKIAISSNPRSVVEMVSALVSRCGSRASIPYLAELFDPASEQLMLVINNALSIEGISIINGNSMEEFLSNYQKKATTYRKDLLFSLKELANKLSTEDLASLPASVLLIRLDITRGYLFGFSKTERERCAQSLDYISEFLSLKMAGASTTFELMQSNLTGLKHKLLASRDDYTNHPTELSFLALEPILSKLLALLDSLQDTVITQSLPEITIENDYEEEGYFPINNRIDLMVKLSNGKSGKQCSTASAISLDILSNNELSYYCHCDQTHFELDPPILAGGDSYEYKIPLVLTTKGCVPDTVFVIPVKISYQTIKGTKEEIEESLNIRIKSAEAWIEIDNPYDKAVISPEDRSASLFKGRDADVDSISNILLNSPRGKTVLIYGQFRSGKSSLANFVVKKICDSNPAVLFVDAGQVIDSSADNTVVSIIENFIENICGELELCLDEESPLLSKLLEYKEEKITPDNYPQIFSRFTKTLDKVLKENNRHLLVFLDEFGRFCAAGEDGSKTHAIKFMQLWKSVMEKKIFNAILIGHDVITQMIQEDPNSFGIINLHQINYVSKDATEQIIQEPTRMKNGNSRFTSSAVDYIWRLSAGNVYYIQMICQAAVRFMNKRRINILNELYVRQAIQDWLNNADEAALGEYGHPLYKSGETGERAVSMNDTIAVLDAISQTSSGLIDDIVDFAVSRHGLSAQVVKNAVSSLRARRVIDQDQNSRLSIRVKFYPEYLNEHLVRTIKD